MCERSGLKMLHPFINLRIIANNISNNGIKRTKHMEINALRFDKSKSKINDAKPNIKPKNEEPVSPINIFALLSL